MCIRDRSIRFQGTQETVMSLKPFLFSAFRKIVNEIHVSNILMKIAGIFYIKYIGVLLYVCLLYTSNSFVYEYPDVFCVWQNSLDDETDTVDIMLDFFEENEDGTYERTSEDLSLIHI